MNRRRYTITFEDGFKGVYLGYTPEYTATWAEQQGHGSVVEIIKGDYRKIEAQRKAQETGGFIVDHIMFGEAKELLGIKLPVYIRYHARFAYASGKNGSHILRNSPIGLIHEVMIKSYLTPAQASWVLWHELTHAMQVEREDGDYSIYRNHKQQRHKVPYAQRAWEIEANEMADTMKEFVLCLDKPSTI